MDNIKELRDEFEGIGEVKGFRFKRLLGNGYAYLYEVSGGSCRVYYEVFERVVNDRFGVVSYPKSNAFGKWAMTTYDYDKALIYYDMFSDNVLNRNDSQINS